MKIQRWLKICKVSLWRLLVGCVFPHLLLSEVGSSYWMSKRTQCYFSICHIFMSSVSQQIRILQSLSRSSCDFQSCSTGPVETTLLAFFLCFDGGKKMSNIYIPAVYLMFRPPSACLAAMLGFSCSSCYRVVPLLLVSFSFQPHSTAEITLNMEVIQHL